MSQPAKFTPLRLKLFSALLLTQWLGVMSTQAMATAMVEPESAPSPQAVSTQAADLQGPLELESDLVSSTPALEAAPALSPPEPAPAAEVPIATPEAVVEPPPELAAPEVIAPPAAAKANNSDYIDATPDYNLGATVAEPAAEPPHQVVITERSSGCEATLQAGQGLPASLCASAPAPAPLPVRDRLAAPRSKPARTVYTGSVAKVNSSQIASLGLNPKRSLAAAPAVSFTGTIDRGSASAPSTAYGTTIPGHYQGMQSFKWLVPKLSRLMFPLPLPVPITSAFGWRIHPISGLSSFHTGIDLGAETGTPILAAESGKVAIADWLGGYGLSVLLEHDQGQFATRYAHLSKILVQPGQIVEKGTVIGAVGSTGNSTGPHLHYELLQRTPEGLVAVDPSEELKQALAQLVKALQAAQSKPTPQG